MILLCRSPEQLQNDPIRERIDRTKLLEKIYAYKDGHVTARYFVRIVRGYHPKEKDNS